MLTNNISWHAHLGDYPLTHDDAWYGPKPGSTAWVCNHCGCYAMYKTPTDFYCWDCQVKQEPG